jgi:hypothetical protein
MKLSQLRYGWMVFLLLLTACGGRPLPAPADPELAREALRSALDAWARGEKSGSLHNGAPPVHVTDGDWDKGLRLDKYQLTPAGQVNGPELRCPAQLSLRDKRGRSFKKQVVYLVGTGPLVSIAREEQ